MQDKEKSQNKIGNKSKIHSIRLKVNLYEVCLSYIIYCLIFIL